MLDQNKTVERLAREYLDKLLAAEKDKPGKITKACLKEVGARPSPVINQKRERHIPTKGEEAVLQKISVAIRHYTQGDPYLATAGGKNALFGHINGIDFSLPVMEKTMPKGTELTQMQAAGKGVGETRQGNYYSAYKPQADEIQAEAHARGIAEFTTAEGPTFGDTQEKHYGTDKQVTIFTTTQDIPVLISTAQKITDTWSNPNPIALEAKGGGEQIHINAKENKTVQSELYQKWENAIDRVCSNKSLNKRDIEAIKDTINTQAMVFYNRASFHNNWSKPNYAPVVEALVKLENRFQNATSNKALQKEALEITKSALISAIQMGDELKGKDAGVQATKKADQLIDAYKNPTAQAKQKKSV